MAYNLLAISFGGEGSDFLGVGYLTAQGSVHGDELGSSHGTREDTGDDTLQDLH
jgi:hypothetical protein